MGERAQRVEAVVSSWADVGRPVQAPHGHVTGRVEYLRGVRSRFLRRKRDIIIWLPPDYEAHRTRRYPVLYMHDGQNLMDATTSYVGEWHVDETTQLLVQSGEVEPLIIVGVYNTEDRFSEYTQVRGTGEFARHGGGKADSYGRFLVEELKPVIDRRLRTRPQAQYTGLAGSSLGGLVSLYLGMKHPDTFRRLGVISPTVMWAERDVIPRVRALRRKLPLKIWVDVGTEEWRHSQETVEDSRLLRDALLSRGWVLNKDLAYVEVPGAVHHESAWAARFGDVLKYLYPARK
jgi:predicted alpha/beta superfamily hydrolase